jgi:hypothetical protein
VYAPTSAGVAVNRLQKYSGTALEATSQSEDLSTWIPENEKIPSSESDATNKGYLVCISSYKKPDSKNKPLFLLPLNFEILRANKVFQLEGYSCAKNVLEAKNPTDPNVQYADERSYIGFIGTKDTVDLVFKHDLAVCEDNTLLDSEKQNLKFTVFVSEVNLEKHYGDRLLSHDFIKKGVIPATHYPAADLTADEQKIIRTSFSLRLFNLTITDAENERALLPGTEYAIQGATLNPARATK